MKRRDISLVERYVGAREAQASEARPAMDYIDEDACREAERLKNRLAAIDPGRADAGEYQQLVLEILNFLLNPELIDGQPEVRTMDGTERRDIIFTNDSDEPFWDYVRNRYGLLLMFEAKNKEELDIAGYKSDSDVPRKPNWKPWSHRDTSRPWAISDQEDHVGL